jgi:hypothetical protein
LSNEALYVPVGATFRPAWDTKDQVPITDSVPPKIDVPVEANATSNESAPLVNVAVPPPTGLPATPIRKGLGSSVLFSNESPILGPVLGPPKVIIQALAFTAAPRTRAVVAANRILFLLDKTIGSPKPLVPNLNVRKKTILL